MKNGAMVQSTYNIFINSKPDIGIIIPTLRTSFVSNLSHYSEDKIYTKNDVTILLGASFKRIDQVHIYRQHLRDMR